MTAIIEKSDTPLIILKDKNKIKVISNENGEYLVIKNEKGKIKIFSSIKKLDG